MTDEKDLIIAALIAKFAGCVTIHMADIQHARGMQIVKTHDTGLSYTLSVRRPAEPRMTRGPDLPNDPVDGDTHVVSDRGPAYDMATYPMPGLTKALSQLDGGDGQGVVGSNPSTPEAVIDAMCDVYDDHMVNGQHAAMRAALEVAEGARMDQPAAGEVAGQAVQVIGAVAIAGGIYDNPDVQRALTFFANGAQGDILPYHIDAGAQPAATDPLPADWPLRVERRLAALEKNSHPPIDLTPTIHEIIGAHGHGHAGVEPSTTTGPAEMPGWPSAASECKGDWGLRTACAKCDKCRKTAPKYVGYPTALAIVREFKKTSCAFIQRKMHIGYNEAAAYIEQMEREGIVSKANSAGKRELLKP